MDDTHYDVVTASPSVLSADRDQSLQDFAVILSQAVAERADVRTFLKQEALAMVDNCHNIFYPVSCDKQIGGRTFRDVLLDYTTDETLSRIERTVPLLNIHMPELCGLHVEDYDTTDGELPVLYQGGIYWGGHLVDSLAADEVPGFQILAVTESSTIRLKDAATRSAAPSGDDLLGIYEYVDPCFNPQSRTAATRSYRLMYEELDAKHNPNSQYAPYAEIDPDLIAAYGNAKPNLRATRYLMNYGIDDVDATPGILPNVFETIYRFRVAESFFFQCDETANEGDKIVGKTVSHKKSEYTREQALQLLLAGKVIPVLFHFVGSPKGSVTSFVNDEMVYNLCPDWLFNLAVEETNRNHTGLRHSKYYYKVIGAKSKWVYPDEHDMDGRIFRWDITQDPKDMAVTVYVLNPNAGREVTITEEFTANYVVDYTQTTKLPNEDIKSEITTSSSKSNTIQKHITASYKVTSQNLKLGRFSFDYFNDYPILSVSGQDSVKLQSCSNSGIIVNFLPVSVK